MSRYVDVVFPRPLIHAFTYLRPEGLPPLKAGTRVEAPLGRRMETGFVVREHDDPPADGVALKPLAAVRDVQPLLSPEVVSFTRRLAEYHLSSWGEMLEAALPPAEPTPSRRRAKPAPSPPPRPSSPPQLVLDFSSTPAVVEAEAAVAERVGRGGFAPFLVWGGDAERRALYRRLLRSPALKTRAVLILVPEIDEIGPVRDWAGDASGRPAAVVHGQLSRRAKGEVWAAIRAGGPAVVIGSRAALFGPIPELGLIIVEDEPHEAYLQTESPVFDVRQGARFRAEEEGAVLVYGAAQPSVAAVTRAREGGYLHRLGDAGPRPRVEVVDDGQAGGLLVPALVEGLGRRLGGGGRSILFLNRRGYASVIFCPVCGFIPACRRCVARPAYHRKEDQLVCHACGTTAGRPSSCPRCGGRVLEPRGVGIEALEEEVKRLFPEARLARFDRDLAGRASDQEKILRRYAAGRVDILLGTALLARRAGLPPADFVGLLNPEAWLAFPDFTAAERAFQAVVRMLRFARTEGGEAVLQTGFPDHYSFRAAARGDDEAFYAAELEARRLLGYPPFSSMAEVVLRGREARILGMKARILAARLAGPPGEVEVVGPALATAPEGRGTKTVQVVLRAKHPDTITEALNRGLRQAGGGWRVGRWS